MLREDMKETFIRNASFMTDACTSGILCNILRIDEIALPPIAPLEMWPFPNQITSYIDKSIDRLVAFWQGRRSLHDDLLPSFHPYFGIAEHSAFFGGSVTYGGDTSYHHPIIDSIDDIAWLEIQEDSESFSMLKQALLYSAERAQDVGYIPSLRGGESPLDIANALRGNDLFYDMYEKPDRVKELVSLCAQGTEWTFTRQQELVGSYEGGYCTGFGIWLPGNAVGHMSEDTSSMCSQVVYEQFGKPYTQKALSAFDQALIHVHSMGHHIIESIASLEKVSCIQIERDPNQRTPLEIFAEYASVFKRKVAIIDIRKDEIEQALKLFVGHKVIVNCVVKTVQEGQYMLDALAALRWEG